MASFLRQPPARLLSWLSCKMLLVDPAGSASTPVCVNMVSSWSYLSQSIPTSWGVGLAGVAKDMPGTASVPHPPDPVACLPHRHAAPLAGELHRPRWCSGPCRHAAIQRVLDVPLPWWGGYQGTRSLRYGLGACDQYDPQARQLQELLGFGMREDVERYSQ